EDEDRLAVGQVDEGFNLAVGGDVVRRFSERINREDAGGGELFKCGVRSAGCGIGTVACGGGLLDVGRVAARFAKDHLVFARIGRDHELVRKFAAHHAGVGFGGHGFESAALKDAVVGLGNVAVADLVG